MTAPVVVIGSGLAGYNLAREFRKLDKETPLVVVSRDHAGFYSKPMLSNALAGNKTAATLGGKRGEIDDHAVPLRHEAAQNRLTQVECAFQIDVDHPFKVGKAGVEQRAAFDDTCCIDQNVD